MPGYGLVDADYAQRLRAAASRASGGSLYTLSLGKFRPEWGQPLRGDGYRDPDNGYIPIPLLTVSGATLCMVARVVAGPADWDRVGVIWYPSRGSLVGLLERRETIELRARKEQRMGRVTVLGIVPIGPLPVADGRQVLLEVWNGAEPPPVADGPSSAFVVDGTYIGDGRQWSGVRYTSIEAGTALPLLTARFGYQALLLEPVIQRWR